MDHNDAMNHMHKGNSIVKDKLEREAWDLYMDLSKEYSSKFDQYKDMIKMGEIAKAIVSLSEAENKVLKVCN